MKNDLHDSGLESFLRLLDPELAIPLAAVEPKEIRLRFDKAEKIEIPLPINILNKGRGYLSGTIELSEQVPGFSLSANRFSLNSNRGSIGREISIVLLINAKQLTSGRDYHLSLVINTNGTPERLVVPVHVSATDRKARAHQMSGLILKYGLALALVYGLLLFDRVSMIFGLESPLREPGNLIIIAGAFWFTIYSGLLTNICLPLALLISGRRPGWFTWLLFFGCLTFVVFAANRAISEGSPEAAWPLVTIFLLPIIPLLISIATTRFVYYRFPYLPGILSLAIMVSAFALFFLGWVF